MNRFLLAVLGIALLLILLAWYFSNIFFYLIISLIIATLLRPLVNWLASLEIAGWNIPRVLIILVSYVSFLFFLGVFVLLFIPLILEQIDVLSSIEYEQILGQVMVPIERFETFLLEKELTDQQPGFIVNGIRNAFIDMAARIDVGAIFNEVLSLTGSVLLGLMAVSFITFFLLYEQGLFRRTFIELVPNKYFEIFINALHKIERLLSNYLLGLLIQAVTIFTMVSLGLTLIGVQYAMTIALFAAVANLIPYLGPILGGLFGLLVGFSTSYMGLSNEALIYAIEILAVFSIVQLTDNLLLQPLIFSKSVKAHPLEIFVIIFVGATIAGILGMIAAIPAYTVVRVSATELYGGLKKYRVFKIRS